MPTPKICRSYNLSPSEYDDCINYRGHYATPANGGSYNKGGLLKGPSHAQGGIPARLRGGGEIELEGGEYIVNAQTVDAVGEQFLDQLNSTATTYHQGGYSQGQLPSPSNYKRGGRVMQRRKRMKRGGRARKRFQTGGHAHETRVPTHGHIISDFYAHGQHHDIATSPNPPPGDVSSVITQPKPMWVGYPWYPEEELLNEYMWEMPTTSSPGTHTHAGRPRSQQQFKRGGKSMVRTRMARGGRPKRKMQFGGAQQCRKGFVWSPFEERCVQTIYQDVQGDRPETVFDSWEETPDQMQRKRGGRARKMQFGGAPQCRKGFVWSSFDNRCVPIATGSAQNLSQIDEGVSTKIVYNRRGGRVRQNRKRMKHGGGTHMGGNYSTSNMQTSGYTGGGELWCTTHTSTAGCGSGGEDGSYAGDYYSKNGRIYGGLEVHDGSVQIRPTPLLSK